jgi:hypothetical protein
LHSQLLQSDKIFARAREKFNLLSPISLNRFQEKSGEGRKDNNLLRRKNVKISTKQMHTFDTLFVFTNGLFIGMRAGMNVFSMPLWKVALYAILDVACLSSMIVLIVIFLACTLSLSAKASSAFLRCFQFEATK